MKQGISGKKLAVGVVVALVGTIAALILGYVKGRTLRGEILVELPIPPSTSTEHERVLIRRGFDQRRHLFLLRERDGEEVWRERRVLYGLQEGTTPLISGDVLLIRTRRSSGLHETHAFGVDDGIYRWSGATPVRPLDGTGAPGRTFARAGVVTEVYQGDPGELIGVTLDEGREVYRQSLRIPDGNAVTLEGDNLRVPGDPALCFSQRSGQATDCSP